MNDSLKIKEKVKERYGKIALEGGSCCVPLIGMGEGEGGSGGCCTGSNKIVLQPLQSQSPVQVAELVGYDSKKLRSIPETSILGVGCGAPTKFAFIKEGDTVVDLGSGAGIDVVKDSGRVIGIDMTDEMLEKARHNAADNGYEPMSAGTKPISQINPLAIQVMNEIGIDISKQKPKDLSEDLMKNSDRSSIWDVWTRISVRPCSFLM
jgi:hypothetical protein